MIKNTSILKKIWPYLLIIAPLTFFFINYNYTPKFDWLYFNSLAHYSWPIFDGKLNFIDINICGGVDNFANPQMWYFSPLNILYLLVGAYWGNVLSWYVCGLVGFCYFYKICERYTTDVGVSKLLSLIFVFASFFSLHFLEGHIVFRTFFLIPAVYYYAAEKVNINKLSFLVLILTIMILDGGIYPFFFSLVMLPFILKLKYFQRSYLFNKFFITISFACLLILLSKIIPVLFIHAERMMLDDPEVYSFTTLLNALYYPFYTNLNNLPELKYRAHEYALYLGTGLTLICLFNIKHILKKKEFYFSLFFLWIASGLGGDINPWRLIKSIPYLQQIHVQSRFLILFFFFLLICLLKSKKLERKTNKFFLSLALIESFFVCFYIVHQGFQQKIAIDSYSFFNKKVNIKQYDKYVPKPIIYGVNKLSYDCYEPAIQKRILPGKKLFFNTTEGTNPTLSINNDYMIIRLNKRLEKPLIVNVNWNAGWECMDCDITYNEGIIQIDTLGKKEYKLIYKPLYSPLIFLTWFIGILVGLYGWRKYKNI